MSSTSTMQDSQCLCTIWQAVHKARNTLTPGFAKHQLGRESTLTSPCDAGCTLVKHQRTINGHL